MRKYTLFIILLCFVTISVAQPAGYEKIKNAKRIDVASLNTNGEYESTWVGPDENLNDLFIGQIDSLLNSWFIQNSYVIANLDEIQQDGIVVSLPDSVYIKRLQNIDSYVPLSYNNTVKNLIELYTQRKRGLTEVFLGLSTYYFPMIEEQLDKHNLPMELKYLPIIESALNPNARSHANAVGLWQFMYDTGKRYRLEIGTFIDERRDPQKSTEAAIAFLKDLYGMYKDWHLAIAAYNCGPGNVNKAIRRAGGTKDYWAIYHNLPRETRGYVPAYIAAAYVMNYYQEHSLTPRYPDFPIITDTIIVNNKLHFSQISERLNISIEELRTLNPQYRIDIIPGREDKPYTLIIPLEHVGSFIDNERQIFAHRRDEIFPNNEIVIPKTATTYSSDVEGKDKLIYTVKSGDTPGIIASWYKVRLNDLIYWNNIRRNIIRTGQKLTIYVPKGYGEHYARIDKMNLSEKQQFAKQKPVANSQAVTSKSVSSDAEFVYYTVQNGDTLWSIAQKFPGVSNNDIMRLNNLAHSKIQPGQKLKIQSKSN